jgi:hypothetical protein
MPTSLSTVQNETASKKILAYREAVYGVAGTPTSRWMGDLSITKTADLAEREEMTGGYDRMVSPRQQPATFAGTYAEDLSFENFPQHLQYWIKGGVVGATDGETTPGYLHTYAPTFNRDDIDSATLQYGVDGLGNLSTGVRHDDGTITIDVDDTDGVWKFSSSLFVRSKVILPTVITGTATGGTATTLTDTGAALTPDALIGRFINFGDAHTGQVYEITDNTETVITWAETADPAPTAGTPYTIESAFTAGISIPDNEYIPTYGTQVFIDPLDGTIGTTEVLDRIISLNVQQVTNRAPKRFLNNSKNEVSKKTGRGGRRIMGQIRVEFDRFDETRKWEALEGFKLRVYQEGSVIDSGAGTVKFAQIDLNECYFATPNEDARENNMTQTIPFWAYLSASDPILEVQVKNALSAVRA